MAYVLATVGLVFLADQIYENVMVPIGLKIGHGIDTIKEIPNNIKEKHKNHQNDLKKEQRHLLIENIKEKQLLRKQSNLY